MSRFSDNSVQSSPAIGLTAGGLLLEKFGRLFDRYLLRAYPPARLKASEAADLLGFHEDDITILVRQKLIEPLGGPAHNAVKYFALVDVEKLGKVRDELSVATKFVYTRNEGKSGKGKSGKGCAQKVSDYLVGSN
jgi:hypothetical protein